MTFDLPSIGFLSSTTVIIIQVLLLVVALAVVPHKRRPSSALAWLLLIFALPVVGIVLFAIIGSPKLPRVRREHQRAIDQQIREATRSIEPMSRDHDTPNWLPGVVSLNQNLGAMPLLEGNTARLIPHFGDQLGALVLAVQETKRHLHVEFYILSLDDTTRPFFVALQAAVERGVEVRLLLDHMGSRGYPGYKRACRELTRIGVAWRLMLPVQPLKGRYQRPDLRNHRKLMVADGEVGFVGSLNLIDPSYQKRKNRKRGLQWRDLLARLEGPVVHEVDALFVTDWFSETGEMVRTSRELTTDRGRRGTVMAQVAPSGPGFELENNLLLFNSLLYYAERRISITSPYFVPDESLSAAIVTAARRGVQVELFVGAIGDQFGVFHAQHSYYEDLLAAGVRIWLYPAPSILHAKHVSVDDLVTVVGSSNMDIRSFNLDLELSLFSCDRGLADQMRRIEDEYRMLSRELTADDWAQRGRWHRLIDNAMRLTSAVQ